MSTHNEDYDYDYLVSLIDPSTGPTIINAFCAYIKSTRVKFDTVVCRGTSGLLVAPTVCHRLDKHLIISRKNDDGSHAMHKLEGYRKPERFIIVDDLLASGRTVDAVLDHMKDFRYGAKCVGIFLYRSDDRFKTDYKSIPRFNQEVVKLYTDLGNAIPGVGGIKFLHGPNEAPASAAPVVDF